MISPFGHHFGHSSAGHAGCSYTVITGRHGVICR